MIKIKLTETNAYGKTIRDGNESEWLSDLLIKMLKMPSFDKKTEYWIAQFNEYLLYASLRMTPRLFHFLHFYLLCICFSFFFFFIWFWLWHSSIGSRLNHQGFHWISFNRKSHMNTGAELTVCDTESFLNSVSILNETSNEEMSKSEWSNLRKPQRAFRFIHKLFDSNWIRMLPSMSLV